MPLSKAARPAVRPQLSLGFEQLSPQRAAGGACSLAPGCGCNASLVTRGGRGACCVIGEHFLLPAEIKW